MAISPYIRTLRAHVGAMRLQLPSVSAHIFDEQGRLLLVCQREDDVWSTPGGFIEPDERPADAVVRETWEETGLVVRAERILGVFGGPEFVVIYPNGDETQYVITAFGCTVVGGALLSVTDETRDARFWSRTEAATLSSAPWLATVLSEVYAASSDPVFQSATWQPGHRAEA